MAVLVSLVPIMPRPIVAIWIWSLGEVAASSSRRADGARVETSAPADAVLKKSRREVCGESVMTSS